MQETSNTFFGFGSIGLYLVSAVFILVIIAIAWALFKSYKSAQGINLLEKRTTHGKIEKPDSEKPKKSKMRRGGGK